MKKTAIATLCLLSAGLLLAQEPTTTWPYRYSDFKEGQIVLLSGKKMPYRINIHYGQGKLHYIEKGLIKEASLLDVAAAEVGTDRFIPVNGEMMEVMATSEYGCVVQETLADFSALNQNTGAYGTSSAASATTKLSSVQLEGQANQNHMLLLKEKENGKALPLVSKYYIVTPAVRVRASRNDVADILDESGKVEFKTWLKSHKVKWSNPESLLQVADFLNGR